MLTVDSFTFNPFQENTYIVSDETKECLIIDPGCYTTAERDELSGFIENRKLKPVRLINTHCHIDHVLGNKFIADKYKLQVELHLLEIPLLNAVSFYAPQYGIFCEPSPEPFALLKEDDSVKFGSSELKVLITPGHSPGSICLFSEIEKLLISGDVLFQMSIGRTDLPGGDHQALIKSIREKLFILDDKVKVYPGHGAQTSIGFEKSNNPFL